MEKNAWKCSNKSEYPWVDTCCFCIWKLPTYKVISSEPIASHIYNDTGIYLSHIEAQDHLRFSLSICFPKPLNWRLTCREITKACSWKQSLSHSHCDLAMCQLYFNYLIDSILDISESYLCSKDSLWRRFGFYQDVYDMGFSSCAFFLFQLCILWKGAAVANGI